RETMTQCTDACKGSKEYAQHFIDRFAEIKKTLLTMEAFKNYLGTEGAQKDFNTIIEEYKRYNDNVVSLTDLEPVKVNIEQVTGNYQNLLLALEPKKDEAKEEIQIIDKIPPLPVPVAEIPKPTPQDNPDIKPQKS